MSDKRVSLFFDIGQSKHYHGECFSLFTEFINTNGVECELYAEVNIPQKPVKEFYYMTGKCIDVRPFFKKNGKLDLGKYCGNFAESVLVEELKEQAGEWQSCVDWNTFTVGWAYYRCKVERLYEQYGCKDYMLRDLDDLKNIHGVDVAELKGYSELPREQRELFDKTIIDFYNAHGLDLKMSFQPKCVHYVYEVSYADNENFVVGEEVFIIKPDGETVGKRLHRHIFEKDVDLNTCKKCPQTRYLRFELKSKGGWYHFTPEGKWY